MNRPQPAVATKPDLSGDAYRMNTAIVTGSAGLDRGRSRSASSAPRVSRSSASTITCGRPSSATTPRPSGAAANWRRPSPAIAIATPTSATRTASRPCSRATASDIALVVHTAAQPSHDWAAKDPHTDFSVNANGTLVLLEATRKHCPDAVFIFTSTNKVYGDNPNNLPLVEQESRWEVAPGHPFAEHGIDESMSVDQTKHSLFGVSKLAADAMAQEYGRYFGMKTGIFRGGCLTGPGHSGTMLHGFLSYLVKCAITGQTYTVFGYKGKQVRDNIHSFDLINMFWHFYQAPRPGEVYNAGGGRHSNCSMKEAIAVCEQMAGKKMNVVYSDQNRIGDHIWYISDTRKFQIALSGLVLPLRPEADHAGDLRLGGRRPASWRGGFLTIERRTCTIPSSW